MEIINSLDEIIVGRVKPHIYAFTTNTIPNYLKVGDTYRPVSARLNEWKEYFPELEKKYDNEALINEYTYFRDYSVHQYLENELGKERLTPNDICKEIYYSNEFFKDTSDRDLDEAISDIKKSCEQNLMKYQYYNVNTRLRELTAYKRSSEFWKLRPNQLDVVNKFKNAVNNDRKNLLMYAVMRFGKSFTALCCAEAMKETKLGEAKIVLVVSAKADVLDEWRKTVQIPQNFKLYDFLTSDDLEYDNNIIEEKISQGRKILLFLTLQDLQGTKIKEKHKKLFEEQIDLLLIDETHFGARAEKYGEVLREKDVVDNREDGSIEFNEANNQVKTLHAKVRIHLSGTPYRILMGSEFEKEDIIAFYQFTDIIHSKDKWDIDHLDKDEWENPYYGFPQMIRFAFNPSEMVRKKLDELNKNGVSYAFSELFKTKSIRKTPDNLHLQFKYEKEVLDLLEVIDGSKLDKNVLGFLDYDKIKSGKMCHHIVIVLPYCASCDAMEKLIKDNANKFKNLNDYNIINISGVDDTNIYKKVTDVKNTINKFEEQGKKTLTLTVNRMLTGSTVPEWDTMIYLKDTSSPQEYDQAIFRLQNQYVIDINSENGSIVKFNNKPQTLLVDFDPNRMFIMQELKSKIYDVNVEKNGNSKLKDRLSEELKISPIITMNSDKIKMIEPVDIMDAVSNYSKERGVYEETNDIPIDMSLLQDENISHLIQSQGIFGTKQGLKLESTSGSSQEELDLEDFDSQDLQNIAENDNNEKNNKEDDLNNSKNFDNEKGILLKKWRTYYARILFFATLTKSNVISLMDIINQLDYGENERIAKNLLLEKEDLLLIHNKIDPFVLSQLDYKIQNMNRLINDENLTELSRAEIAINKFDKLSESEIITPQNICNDIFNSIGIENMINILNNGGKVLDIASKEAEFALSLTSLFEKSNIDKSKYKNSLYAIPTSGIAYEFTRKIYEILQLNTDNIASRFTTFDLLNIRDNDETKLDIKKIKKYILCDNKFSDIELSDNIFNVKENGDMKFEIIVGNPPYQEAIGNQTSNKSLAKQLFPPLMIMSIELSNKYVSLITPSRWFNGEGQDHSFPKLRQYLKDNNCVKEIHNYLDSSTIFPNVNLGSVNYFLYDKNYTGNVDFYEINKHDIKKVNRPLFENGMSTVLPQNILKSYIDKIVITHSFTSMSSIVSGRNPFGVPSNDTDLNRITSDTTNSKNNIPIYCSYDKVKYISNDFISRNRQLFNSWKVFTSKMNGGAGILTDEKKVKIIGKNYVAGPETVCSNGLIAIGLFNNENEAKNLSKYMNTKFFRFMVGINKSSQVLTSNVYLYAPLQNFTENSDIDWNKSLNEVDQQLYKKYNLSTEEINYIENKIITI
jgi:superfamily II DNA or RNA helicase